VTLVWHAGEPLVLGADYYEAAFSTIQAVCPSTLQLEHAFQTNGMLINDRWCELFRKWNVGVGVSIDGPRSIHDAARRTRNGKGTFDKTVSGMKRLQAHEVPFYVISVLSRLSLLQPDAMFTFFQELGIHDVGFNIEEQEGRHTTSTLHSERIDQIYVEFLARFSELMVINKYPIAVRELEEVLGSIGTLQDQGPMSNERIPFGIITVDVRGDVFTFSPELVGYSSPGFPTFSIGNIYRNTFDEMRASAVLAAMTADIEKGIEKCRATCQYFRICGGGTPSNKCFENGTFNSTETMYCRLTRKRVTDFVLSQIESRIATAQC
jgi:uncharacterized protein